MASSNVSESSDLTPSQKKKRQIRDIQAELALFTEEDLLKVEVLDAPDSKRPKLVENSESNASTTCKPSKLLSEVVVEQNQSPYASDTGEKGRISSSKSVGGILGVDAMNESEMDDMNHDGASVMDESGLDASVDLEVASQYLGRIATKSGHGFLTHFSNPPVSKIGSSSSLGSSGSLTKESAEVKDDYRVTRVHHSKSSKEYERLLKSLKESKEMVVIGYHTNGDSAKEFSSTRGSKDLPKNVMVPAFNPKEQVQMMAIRIDDQDEVFELELTPQTSNAFALMQKASSMGIVEAHYLLLRDIIKRKIISSSIPLVIYNTQRLLRLLEFNFKKSSSTPTTGLDFQSFDEPPLDPFVAGYVLNPEMGVEPDQERTALSMRSYEFEPMMKAYCPKYFQSLKNQQLQKHQKNQQNSSSRQKAKNMLADDTFHTRELVLAVFEMLKKDDLIDVFVFEMRIAVVLAKMEVPGMMVDLQMLEEPRKAIEIKLKDLHSLAAQILGHDILLSSPSQVSSAIYSGLEEYVASAPKPKNSALRRTSADKHLSTKENALLELKKLMKADGMTHMKQYKLVEIVLESRPIHKLQSFLEAVEITAEKTKDPRMRIVYPRWLQCNTGTGRITGASPNMQTQPTPDEIRLLALGDGEHVSGDAQLHLLSSERFGSALESGAQNSSSASSALSIGQLKIEKINIRSSYVSREGYTLVGADYSQIEMRILAQVSNDEQLIHFFKTGLDIHRQVASRVFKIPPEQVSSQQREWCKRIVYGIVYGMGVQALSKSLDISTARGREFYESFMGSFPKVQQWINNTKAHIRSTFMVHTMLGRIRKFQPGGNTDAGKYLRQGVNTTIQGSAADIVKLAMVDIDTQIYEASIDAKLLLQIHDELIYEVKDSDIEPFKVIMKRCMEQAVPHFDVPLTINIETGHSWGLMAP